MYQLKDVTQDIKSAAKRRKGLLIITPLLFLAMSIGIVFMIEPKYQSSTSILVQKDETLNPLVMFEMAVTFASEDRLQSFNEIIYSRSTMEMLIDSLKLDSMIRTEAEKQELIANLRKRISTSSRASDSFEISFMDNSPVRARDGTALLAEHFIRTRLMIENRRNNETVNFFQAKLAELEEVVDRQRDQVVTTRADQLREIPADQTAMQARLQSIENQLESIELNLFQEEQTLEILREFQNHQNPDEGIPLLYRLPLSEIQFGEELRTLLNEYENLRQQFTPSFPRVRALASQITQTANRIPATIETNITRLERQRQEVIGQRNRLMGDLERAYVAQQRATTQQSDFSIYEGLYNEMKVKLEQAKMTRDIGDRAAEQFLVLDAPFIPEKPAKPNKRLIVSLSFALGILIGVILSSVAEVLDTTIRSEEDLPFDKPVIAYLPAG